jgi:toxin-antitoxin system PIN domain toxin
MIVPDLNLLLYAYDTDSPFHEKASLWWQECLSGDETVGLPAVVLFGFVRIATNLRVFEHPMTAGEAAQQVETWLARPPAQILEPGRNHVENVLKSLESLGTAGNLVAEAQIVAIAIEYDAVLHTNDTDFQRFGGLRWFNPLTGAASRK